MTIKKAIKPWIIDFFSKTFGRYLRIKQIISEPQKIKPNLWEVLCSRALQDTAEFVENNLNNAVYFFRRDQIFDQIIIDLLKMKNPRVYEFGVWEGKSINYFQDRLPLATIYGFDSFLGLPEDWTGTHTSKSYFDLNGKIPSGINVNVRIVKGLYRDTLLNFQSDTTEDAFKIDLLHLDCDIYSSTKFVLDSFSHRIHEGTLLLFDEYFGYPNWRNHEFRAFKDFCSENSVNFEYKAYSTRQVLIKILSKNLR